MILRPELAGDRLSIRAVNLAAFPSPVEADLVDQLRADGEVVISLVAEQDDRVIGHILFCRVRVGTVEAVSLSPMAVLPEWQRQGVGSALVSRGLELCRERGEKIAVVLGHPGFYPRFGFSAGLARQLEGYSSGPEWMALELTPGSLTGLSGKVLYPKAFESSE